MKTVRCPECNLVNWATAVQCKRCRNVLQAAEAVAVETASVGGFQTVQASVPPMQNPVPANNFSDLNNSHDFGFRETPYQQTPPASNYRPAANNFVPVNSFQQPNPYQSPNLYQSRYQPTNLKSGLAIASMVFGILGFVSSIFLIGLLLAPIGLILGIVALVKASRKPNEYGGKGFAIAGVVTSALVVLIIPVIAAIAIPNILAAKRAANEGSAISSIRSISKSVGGVKAFANSAPMCVSLQEMAANKAISEGLADGEHNGYRFAVNTTPNACEVTATPVNQSTGTRSFFYSTADGKIRGATKQGAIANNSDAVID